MRWGFLYFKIRKASVIKETTRCNKCLPEFLHWGENFSRCRAQVFLETSQFNSGFTDRTICFFRWHLFLAYCPILPFPCTPWALYFDLQVPQWPPFFLFPKQPENVFLELTSSRKLLGTNDAIFPGTKFSCVLRNRKNRFRTREVFGSFEKHTPGH